MNLFQWIVAPLMLGMALAHASRTLRGQEKRSRSLFWALVWGLGGLMVLRPGLSNALAGLVGIGRGTDLVLYLAVIAGLFTAFAQYRQNRRLETMITELVRHTAIENASGREPARAGGATARFQHSGRGTSPDIF